MTLNKKPYFTKSELIGIIAGALIIVICLVLFFLNIMDTATLSFILGIAVVIAGIPFLMTLLLESQEERDKDRMFLEFARDLVEGVKSGTPISKSIINVKTKDYASLSPHVQKLANQIAIGIPVKDALEIFARDVNSSVISRAVSLIREAEKSGGRIENILESVSFSVAQIETLKKERKAAVYNLTVQGYIIFLIFIAIMLVMQFNILPMVGGLDLGGISGGFSTIGTTVTAESTNKIDSADFTRPFLLLLLCQGFFAGLVIGKISEGRVKYGFKHSFILVALAWLISTGANLVLRVPQPIV